MRQFYEWRSIYSLLGPVLIVLMLVGCNQAETVVPGSDSQETLPAAPTGDPGDDTTPPDPDDQEILPAIDTPEIQATVTEGTGAASGEAPATPLIVHLSMSKAPKMNEVVEVVLEVEAYRDAPGTTAQIELPPGAQVVNGELQWEGEVKVDSPVQLTASVIFTQEGEYTLWGSARRPVSADLIWGDDDYIYLTVKPDAGFFGFESGDQPQLTASPVITP